MQGPVFLRFQVLNGISQFCAETLSGFFQLCGAHVRLIQTRFQQFQLFAVLADYSVIFLKLIIKVLILSSSGLALFLQIAHFLTEGFITLLKFLVRFCDVVYLFLYAVSL